jgi:hypothetical protein
MLFALDFHLDGLIWFYLVRSLSFVSTAGVACCSIFDKFSGRDRPPNPRVPSLLTTIYKFIGIITHMLLEEYC